MNETPPSDFIPPSTNSAEREDSEDTVEHSL